jgi:hypothetical protein
MLDFMLSSMIPDLTAISTIVSSLTLLISVSTLDPNCFIARIDDFQLMVICEKIGKKISELFTYYERDF